MQNLDSGEGSIGRPDVWPFPFVAWRGSPFRRGDSIAPIDLPAATSRGTEESAWIFSQMGLDNGPLNDVRWSMGAARRA